MKAFDSLGQAALRRPVAAILLFSALTLLPGLGNGWLYDRDETWYASCAMNMVQSGDWLVPRLGERTFLEKPPLGYWLMALAFEATGKFGEFEARFPSAVMGAATLLIVYGIGAWTISRSVGLIAAGLLATALMFGVLSRAAILDATLVAGMSAGLACWWRMQEPGDQPTNYWLWCALGGVGVGWAVLAKGPLGLLPGVIALAYMAARRDFAFLRRANVALLAGVAAIALVAGPWYWLIAKEAGDQFVGEFLLKHNVGRFGSAMQGHSGPFWYYLPIIVFGMMPWTFLLAATQCQPRRPKDRLDLMLALWVAAPVLLFSIVATKLPHYVAPAFPPLAIFAARDAAWRVERRGAERTLAAGFWFWAVVGAAICGLAIAAPRIIADFPSFALLVPGVAMLLGFGAAIVARRRNGLAGAFWAAGAAMTASCLAIMLLAQEPMKFMQPGIAATLDAKARLASRPDAKGRQPAAFIAFNHFEPGMFFYSEGAVVAGKEERLLEELAALKPRESLLALCREKDEERLEEALRGAGAEWSATRYEAIKPEAAWLKKRLERSIRRFRLLLVEAWNPDGAAATEPVAAPAEK